MYNAYIQRITETETFLVNAYKGGVILSILIILLLKNKYHKIIKLFFTLVIFYFISLAYWSVSGYLTNISSEIKDGIKRFYPYMILLFLLSNRKYIKSETVINCLILYGCLFVGSLIYGVFTGSALQYYKGRGISITGLVLSGNDFGLTMLMTNCMVCYMYLHTAQKRYAVVNIALTVMTILIGTVAGVLGSLSIMICFVGNGLFIKHYKKLIKPWQRVYTTVLLFLAVPMLIFTIYVIISYSEYSQNKFALTRLLSGGARNWLKEAAIENLMNYSFTDFIFGIGADNCVHQIGSILGWTEIRPIEIDHYALISYFGILFGGSLIILPLIFTGQLIHCYFKLKTSFYFWASFAMLFFIIHGFSAGHAYTSVLAMQTGAAIYFCYYKQKYDLEYK
jgi:hypothetical protein